MKKILSMLMVQIYVCTLFVFTPVFTKADVPAEEYTYEVYYDGFENWSGANLNAELANDGAFGQRYNFGVRGNKRTKRESPTEVSTRGYVMEFSTPAESGVTGSPKAPNFFYLHQTDSRNYILSNYSSDYNTWKKFTIGYDFYPVGYSNKIFKAFYDGSNSNRIDLAYMNSDGTFGSVTSSAEGTYNLNTWNKLIFEFDLASSPKKYKVHLNDVTILTNNIDASTIGGIHRFGFEDCNYETATTYFDNISYKLIPFELKSSTIENGNTNAQITDSLTLSFTKEIAASQENLVSITVNSDAAVPCTKTISGKDFIINLDSVMDFETEYKITINTNMVDTGGKNLKHYMTSETKPETIEIKFTTMEQGLVVDVPVISSGSVDSGAVMAESVITNYTATPMNVKMFGGVYNSDGKQLCLSSGEVKTLSLNETDTVSAEIIYADMDEYTVKFFPVNFDDMKLLRADWLTLEPSSVASLSPASLSSSTLALDKLEAPDSEGNISVSGTYATGKPVLIYLKDEGGAVLYANPIIVGSNNRFEVHFTLAAGTYTAYAYAFDTDTTVSSVNSAICMTTARKNQIINTVNNAVNVSTLKNAFETSGGFKEDLMLPSGVYTDSAYQLLFEQKSYTSVDTAGGIKEKITEFSKILPGINSCDWTSLKTMLSSKSGLILNNKSASSSYAAYNALTDDGKSRVCQLTVRDEAFTSLNSFRSALASAITTYKSELEALEEEKDDGGGSYFGGGGASPMPSVPVIPNPVIPPQASDEFTDLAGYEWAENAIYALRDANIISKDTAYRPYDAITREEYVKLIVMLMGIDISDSGNSFNDVDASKWYAPYVKAAKDAGIVTGQGDNLFGVGSHISRQDMMVMAYRALANAGKLEVQSAGELPFTDADTVSDYARDILSVMYNLGIINGMDDNTIAPLANANRAQAAKIIYELLSLM